MAKPLSHSNAKQTRHLTKPLLMEDSLRPRMFLRLGAVACCFGAALTAWGSMAQMRGTIVATGQVTPISSLPIVQSQEEGRITKILIKEGQVIDKGAPLIHLKSSATTSTLEKFRARAALLSLRKERLDAALQNRQLKFGPYAKKYAKQAREQREILSQTRLHNAKANARLTAQVKHHDAKVDELTKQADDLARQVELQAKHVKTRSDFLKQGVVSIEALMEVRRIYEKLHSELLNTRVQLNSELEALNEARTTKLEFDVAGKKKWLEEHAGIMANLQRLNPKIAVLKARAARLFVRAPIRGLVQELIPQKSGELIETGSLVAKIMPLSQEMSAEIQLGPNEMGHIKIGQQVQVKINAFDTTHFGEVKGVIRKISATSGQSGEGKSFHKVVIALSRNYVKRSSQNYMIRPGMRVSVLFVTGDQSFADYVLKPVYRSVNIAFAGY